MYNDIKLINTPCFYDESHWNAVPQYECIYIYSYQQNILLLNMFANNTSGPLRFYWSLNIKCSSTVLVNIENIAM